MARATLDSDHTIRQPGVNYCGTLTYDGGDIDLASGKFGAQFTFQSEIGVNEDAIKSATIMVFDRFKRAALERGFTIDHESIEYQVLGNGVDTEAIFQIAANVKHSRG